MLSDDLLERGDAVFDYPLGDGFSKLATAMADARKFVLDRSVSLAVDALALDEVEKALPFCRPPYPLTWIEVAQADRPRFWRGLPLLPSTAPIKRVGVLIDSRRTSEINCFAMHLAWSFPSGGVRVAASAAIYDESGEGVALLGPPPATDEGLYGDELLKRAAMAPSPYFVSAFRQIVADYPPPYGAAVVQAISNDSSRDWSGEGPFWLGVLALLNAKNAVAAEPISQPALNRKRIRSGKAPLSDYHLCRIRLSPSETATARGSATARDAAVRAHFVRGHFKRRGSGLFWWSAHARGDFGAGFANKDYRVTRAAS